MSDTVRFTILPEFESKLKGLKIGFAYFSDIQVQKSNPLTEKMLMEACQDAKKRFNSVSDITEDKIINGIRKLFSKIGLDPTKETASGEFLLRKVISGKALNRENSNSIVDVNNSISILSGCPCGVYDISKVRGNIEFIIGRSGESYDGISGRKVNAEKRLLTRDQISIFGGPTADSKRTCVTSETKELLFLMYHPEIEDGSDDLRNLLNDAIRKFQLTNGNLIQSGIYAIS